MRPESVKRPEGPRTASFTTATTMRTEDLVAALFLVCPGKGGEGRDCLADSLSNDGVDNDDGSFVARAGDADGGHLLLLARWRINLIASSRWADRTMRNHACHQAVEPILAALVAAAWRTKTT
jgi:hypothetical protein